jgi:hypothetical protein
MVANPVAPIQGTLSGKVGGDLKLWIKARGWNFFDGDQGGEG